MHYIDLAFDSRLHSLGGNKRLACCRHRPAQEAQGDAVHQQVVHQVRCCLLVLFTWHMENLASPSRLSPVRVTSANAAAASRTDCVTPRDVLELVFWI